MSDINLHDNSPSQDWTGAAVNSMRDAIEQLLDIHSAPLHAAEPVSFSVTELEHIFEQARAALHKDGLPWAEASRLAERIRTRCMGQA